MNTYRFRGIVTAISSITHNGGQKHGTEALLRREKIMQPDGRPVEVPIISGNGVRGKLRDVGMGHLLKALGYGENGKGANLPAFHFLFSGGALTSSGGKAINLMTARELRELIPLVGIFGGSVGNAILPGILICNKMTPIAVETKHLIPWLPEDLQKTNVSVWDFTQREMYTRRNDSGDPAKQKFLSGDARKLLDAATVAKQSKGANEPAERNDGSTTQMMYHVETIAAGTKLAWELVLSDPTDIELEAFMTCLVQFSTMPYVGGKAAVGHGEISVDFRNWIKIDASRVIGSEIGMPTGRAYAKHLEANAGKIRDLLEAWQ